MFGQLELSTIVGLVLALTNVAALPANLAVRDNELATCLDATNWRIAWSGKPILLGKADPVGEFRKLIESSECNDVSCHSQTSESIEHVFANDKRTDTTTYRLQVHEAWWNNAGMKKVMIEAAAQGIGFSSSWEDKHWYHGPHTDVLNGASEAEGEGTTRQVTLPGDEFTLTWKDISACSAYRLKVQFIDTSLCGTWTMEKLIPKTFGLGILSNLDWSLFGEAVDAFRRKVDNNDDANIEITTQYQQPKC